MANQEKWLNVWKVRYNPKGYGAFPYYFSNKDEAESAIKQLKRINTYLFEDMDIPEDSEK